MALVFAAASTNATFTETEWIAGSESQTMTVVFPEVDYQHRKGFAIRADAIEGELTDLRVSGSPFNGRDSYVPAVADTPVTQTIQGTTYRVFVGGSDDYASDGLNEAERTFRLIWQAAAPLDAAPLDAAALTAATLAASICTTEGHAQRLLPVAEALVERYGADAPAAVRQEAAIRTAGYLEERPAWGPGGDSETIGPMVKSRDYAAGSISALRHSGAMALLSPWKVRRAL